MRQFLFPLAAAAALACAYANPAAAATAPGPQTARVISAGLVQQVDYYRGDWHDREWRAREEWRRHAEWRHWHEVHEWRLRHGYAGY